MTSYDEMIKRWLDKDLDAWTRRIIRRHFDPELGSPYWLRRRRSLDFDPRDITRYAELTRLGPFPLQLLRTLDPSDLVPLAVSRPLVGRVWDSGGTTGDPCRIFYTEPMLLHRGVWRRWSFVTEGFEPNATWIQATPTGPHLIGNGTWELSALYDSVVYAIDMDPRWVKRLIRTGRGDLAAEYADHLVDQIGAVLGTRHVDYLSTTPALFDALCTREPQLAAGLRGVRLSGTHISYETYERFTALLGDGPCGRSYGNTFGNGAGLPADPGRRLLPYAPNYPQVTMAVVDPEDWTAEVADGGTGQVRLTILHDDLLLPHVLERDQAVRYGLAGRWPIDGVANVRPLDVLPPTAVEGLY
ncbi:MAG TPA: hypothetical protein VN969_19050 [Streptosporangiaceae bacterium]|nr:hypothetical protein [Streptosporangiaceae bacterium]